MSNMPQDGVKKIRISITINPDILEELKNDSGVINLSAWIENKMVGENLRNKTSLAYLCTCGYLTSAYKWNKELFKVCPWCNKDHKIEDRRKKLTWDV